MSLLQKFTHQKFKDSRIEAIVRNLNYILNTKKGFGSYLKGFGIGDWNEHKSRHAIIRVILEEITENIKLYEPRVKLIEIVEVESELAYRLRFEMKCVILEKNNPLYIIFDSILNDVSVEGKI